MTADGIVASDSRDDPTPEMARLLVERAREDPLEVIGSYPDYAQATADAARAAGHDRLANTIENLIDEAQEAERER